MLQHLNSKYYSPKDATCQLTEAKTFSSMATGLCWSWLWLFAVMQLLGLCWQRDWERTARVVRPHSAQHLCTTTVKGASSSQTLDVNLFPIGYGCKCSLAEIWAQVSQALLQMVGLLLGNDRAAVMMSEWPQSHYWNNFIHQLWLLRPLSPESGHRWCQQWSKS